MLFCVGDTEKFSAHSPHVSVVREQWDQLVGAYPTVKDPPTSCHSSHLESGENDDDLDVESRVESIVARYAEVEGALTEIPEEVEKATADLQAFVGGDYITVLGGGGVGAYVQRGRVQALHWGDAECVG